MHCTKTGVSRNDSASLSHLTVRIIYTNYLKHHHYSSWMKMICLGFFACPTSLPLSRSFVPDVCRLPDVSDSVFYSLSLASLASMALVATWARSNISAACSAAPCDWVFFNKKWLMKSFKPSRSIPSLGIPEILRDGKQWGTLMSDVRVVRSSKQGGFYRTQGAGGRVTFPTK